MPTTFPRMLTHQTPTRALVHAGPEVHRARELNDRLFAAWTNTWGGRPVTVAVDGTGGSALDLACALAALRWEHSQPGTDQHDPRWVPVVLAGQVTAWGELGLDGSVRGGVVLLGSQARVVVHLRELPALVRELALSVEAV